MPSIEVDFNNCDEERRVRLNTIGVIWRAEDQSIEPEGAEIPNNACPPEEPAYETNRRRHLIGEWRVANDSGKANAWHSQHAADRWRS